MFEYKTRMFNIMAELYHIDLEDIELELKNEELNIIEELEQPDLSKGIEFII